MSVPESPPDAALHDPRLELIAASYRRLTGKPLLDACDPLALWNAPCAIVAHGTEDDPVFFYGNRVALQLFEMRFDAFVRLPSRFSAEPMARQARERLLAKVAEQGYVDNYSGVRIASSGRRFMISNGTVWNLLDEAGVRHGQAATFIVQRSMPGG